jgi:hypothetical protein
MEGRLAAPK